MANVRWPPPPGSPLVELSEGVSKQGKRLLVTDLCFGAGQEWLPRYPGFEAVASDQEPTSGVRLWQGAAKALAAVGDGDAPLLGGDGIRMLAAEQQGALSKDVGPLLRRAAAAARTLLLEGGIYAGFLPPADDVYANIALADLSDLVRRHSALGLSGLDVNGLLGLVQGHAGSADRLLKIVEHLEVHPGSPVSAKDLDALAAGDHPAIPGLCPSDAMFLRSADNIAEAAAFLGLAQSPLQSSAHERSLYPCSPVAWVLLQTASVLGGKEREALVPSSKRLGGPQWEMGSIKDRAALEGAFTELSKLGLDRSWLNYPCASVLAHGDAEQIDRLKMLASRCSSPQSYQEALALALLAVEPIPPEHRLALDRAIEAFSILGRRPSAPEIAAIAHSIVLGGDGLHGLDLRGAAGDIRHKDLYTWSKLDPARREQSRDRLITDIGRRLGDQPKPRLWIDDSFATQSDRLTLTELHKVALILDYLRSPRAKTEITRLANWDLDHDLTEAGGRAIIDRHGRFTLKNEPSPTQHSNHSYSPPPDADPSAAVVSFHLHCTEVGDSSAWPSAQDLMAAERKHQDELILTSISETNFNLRLVTSSGVVVNLGDLALDEPLV